MSVSLYEGRVATARKDIERARDKQASEEAKSAKLAEEASKLRERASRATSASSAANYERQAAGKEKDSGKARKKAADHSGDVAKAQRKLHEAESKLAGARQADQRKQDDKAKYEQRKREREEKIARQQEQQQARQQEQARARETARQQEEMSRLRDESSGLREELTAVSRKLAPAEITVLFWASSPEDEAQLRLDKEMREIEKRVRMSDHRDSIRFEYRVARQLGDLIQDLNQTKPHVVHFSGHGNQAGLAFENDEGEMEPLPNDALAALLRATTGRVQLGVFNSCESAAQAELATESIDFAIGMGASVEDAKAQSFAGQFYASLGFGLSIQAAFDQAAAAVTVEHGDGGDIPSLYSAPGKDAAATVLVDPGA